MTEQRLDRLTTSARRANGETHVPPQPQAADLSTDQAVESAALAGAAAIQKLVAERNDLRARLAAQEQETAAYRALNNELRRRLLIVHQTYVDMAKSVVGDLERFDAALRETAQEVHAAATTPNAWGDAEPVPERQKPSRHTPDRQTPANGTQSHRT